MGIWEDLELTYVGHHLFKGFRQRVSLGCYYILIICYHLSDFDVK